PCRPGHHLSLPSFPPRRSSDLCFAHSHVNRPAGRAAHPPPPLRSGGRRAARPPLLPRSFRVSPQGSLPPLPRLTSTPLVASRPGARKSTRLNSSHVGISDAAFC